MPVELLFELVAGVGAELGRRVVTSRMNDAELSKLLKSLPTPHQRGVLEVLAVAAMDDGRVTADEQKMLSRRGDDTTTDLLYEAVNNATEAQPFATPDDLVAYLRERSAMLADDAQRERVLYACIVILNAAGAPDLQKKYELFGRGFSMTKARMDAVLGAVTAGATSW